MRMTLCFICFRSDIRRSVEPRDSVVQPLPLSLGRRHGQGEEEEEGLVRAHPAALHLRPQAHAQASRQGSVTPPVAISLASAIFLLILFLDRERYPWQCNGG